MAILFAALVGLSACAGTPTVRSSDVEQQIEDGLTAQVGGSFAVSCPEEIPSQSGYAFDCSVDDVAGGQSLRVSVVLDDDGGAFTWRVSTPGPSEATSS
jgi:hypothetical protein